MTSSANPRRRRVAGERSRAGAPTAASRTREGATTTLDAPGAHEALDVPEVPEAPVAPDPVPAVPAGGKARPTKAAPPASSAAAEPAEPTAAEEDPTGVRPTRVALWHRWPVAFGVLALGLVALVLAAVVWVQGAQRADAARSEAAATAAARTAVETMLSYDYKTFDQHTAAVEKLLTGSFRSQFAAAAGQSVKPLAVQNQAVVQAKASEVGVMSSGDGTVRVLAFVDQTTTSARLSRPQLDQNRVILTMTHVGDRWLVSRVEAF